MEGDETPSRDSVLETLRAYLSREAEADEQRALERLAKQMDAVAQTPEPRTPSAWRDAWAQKMQHVAIGVRHTKETNMTTERNEASTPMEKFFDEELSMRIQASKGELPYAIKVRLHSNDPGAVQSTEGTLASLHPNTHIEKNGDGTPKLDADGWATVRTANARFVEFCMRRQGYVKAVGETTEATSHG